MADSPRIEAFTVYDIATGAPKAGKAIGPGAAQIHFTTYQNESGVAIAPAPTISEIGGGVYGFTIVFPSAVHCISYVIDTGGDSPAHYDRFARPEDYNPDEIDEIVVSTSAITLILTRLRNLFGI